ncbi:tRNA 2-selenouridine(34) synthase MnmH [Paenibacillus spiritus]|uniref:tRNA 2-selenouridine(34) synthase MnmH n=1 Tax=Paenibacillus spiritus TaxID=2496557 RepID=A0A5J5GAN7_9BACL|nr:tRNA 2-selenouridine(34) synthase MnmH [Paenibacillus spiritus]KAA9004185.1 tRNA 2-selenouridine(34) synthase MnmH [Paenibacillus spiritus]
MFQDISLTKLQELADRKELTVIDVRSPGEYENSTYPGSVNIPLFDNEERAEVGTLYKQASVQAAKQRGLEIVSAKLPAFIRKFEEIPGAKAVFCWRGGMRSRTTATLLSLMDIHVYRLEGGYKAYRKWVVDSLEAFDFTPDSWVIEGYTGTGKTELLRRLAARGLPALDLEGMAGHRGSIFGQVGLRPHNQKTFDSLLLAKLLEYRDAPFVLFEAESMRIGRVVMPSFMGEQKEKGTRIRIELPLEERVRQIMADYRPQEHGPAILDAFRIIKSRIHIPVAAEIERHLLAGRYADAVPLLLEYYYDPLYDHTAASEEDTNTRVLRVSGVDEAEREVVRLLQDRYRLPDTL